ncbi:hypothetical protein N431DRAFT_449537 [Stipitochalara longipes BDJ]|nr:hypothetical protein N431DRAFT_449537 [Stipitochalara longipes BDJ]
MASSEDTLDDIYERLPTFRSLRLLNLTTLAEEDAYRLEVYEIGQCPAYSTMSCTWGPPLNTKQYEEEYNRDSSRTINLVTPRGKKQFIIGRNLYEGLGQMNLTLRTSNGFTRRFIPL